MRFVPSYPAVDIFLIGVFIRNLFGMAGIPHHWRGNGRFHTLEALGLAFRDPLRGFAPELHHHAESALRIACLEKQQLKSALPVICLER
jgi:hypothetical protein